MIHTALSDIHDARGERGMLLEKRATRGLGRWQRRGQEEEGYGEVDIEMSKGEREKKKLFQRQNCRKLARDFADARRRAAAGLVKQCVWRRDELLCVVFYRGGSPPVRIVVAENIPLKWQRAPGKENAS